MDVRELWRKNPSWIYDGHPWPSTGGENPSWIYDGHPWPSTGGENPSWIFDVHSWPSTGGENYFKVNYEYKRR